MHPSARPDDRGTGLPQRTVVLGDAYRRLAGPTGRLRQVQAMPRIAILASASKGRPCVARIGRGLGSQPTAFTLARQVVATAAAGTPLRVVSAHCIRTSGKVCAYLTDVVNGLSLRRSREGDLPVVVQVSGEAALFSRPELKVERVTYPVMTPPAAVGVLESIFWKPEMRYQIVAIEVLKPIKQFIIRRNETTDVAPVSEAIKGRRRVDTVAHRDQRNAVCLRDVGYRVHAHIALAAHADKPVAAYRDQLRRRVRKGACFQQPYLGTREFSADFGLPDDTERCTGLDEEIGIMLHSIHRDGTGGQPRMEWFAARVDAGVLYVPERGMELALPDGGRQ